MGTVSGTMLPNGVTQYLGIPFATALRFHSPVLSTQAFVGGNFAATQYGPSCLQYAANVTTGSEDCLNLNIWVPPGATTTSNLEVMFWIFGGGFISGSIANPIYNGTKLAAEKNVIVVAVNYRLGLFGFAAIQGVPSGMFGIEDQRAGMQWVKRYIGAFGGNPSALTVFGESAGGISACIHAVSPLSAGLFRAVIIESGNCDDILPIGARYNFSSQLATLVGCTDSAVAFSCLLDKSAQALLDASAQMEGQVIFSPTYLGPVWMPCIDGYNLPAPAIQLIVSGSWNRVPVIMGTNSGSMSLFVYNPSNFFMSVNTVSAYNNLLNLVITASRAFATQNITDAMVTNIKNFYNVSKYPSVLDAMVALFSDRVFLCGTRRMVQAFSVEEDPSVYYYNFQHHPSTPPPPSFPLATGAYHFAEVPFVFGNPTCLGVSNCVPSFTAQEWKLSQYIQTYWAGLAKSLNPNGGFEYITTDDGPPTVWPAYHMEKQMLQLNLSLSLSTTYLEKACPLWDPFFYPVYPPTPVPTPAATSVSSTTTSGDVDLSLTPADFGGIVAGAVVLAVFLVLLGVLFGRSRREHRNQLEIGL